MTDPDASPSACGSQVVDKAAASDGIASLATKSDWDRSSAWHEFYDMAFARAVLQGRDEAELRHGTQLLWDHLQLAPRARVFDQGAGIGDIAERLALRGCTVTAIERVPAYVDALRQRAGRLEGPGRLEVVASDIADAEIGMGFDAGYSWHTSFGHARSDADNLALLVRAREALRAGGHFMLDYYGTPALLRQFAARTICRVGQGESALTVTRESELDLVRGLLHQIWRREHASGEVDERRGSTRIYMPHELCWLHEQAGLEVVALFGTWSGEAFSVDSPRCIVLSQRSATP